MQSFSIGLFPPQIRVLAGLAFIVVSFVLNVLLAMGVYSEAAALRTGLLNRQSARK